MSSYRNKYFSGNSNPCWFNHDQSRGRNKTSEKKNTPTKGDEKSGNTYSKIFGQGLVGECLEHEKPQQAIDPFFS